MTPYSTSDPLLTKALQRVRDKLRDLITVLPPHAHSACCQCKTLCTASTRHSVKAADAVAH